MMVNDRGLVFVQQMFHLRLTAGPAEAVPLTILLTST